MIAYFQFRAGMGGHFFLRTLFWRYGYSKRPTPNSYWNEFHFPIELWNDPKFKRIPWDDDHGERWYDWETGEITEYSDEPLRKYLKRSYVQREIASVKKDGFILEHGLYPKFTETFQKALGQECPTFTKSTENLETAKFCRHVRDVKSDCKNHFGIRETTPEAMKIREREIWIEDGPSPQELFDGHKYNDNQNLYLWKQCRLEKKHSDYFLEYEKLVNGDQEPWQMIDDIYKRKSVIPHDEVKAHCIDYHKNNVKLG